MGRTQSSRRACHLSGRCGAGLRVRTSDRGQAVLELLVRGGPVVGTTDVE